jgi:hypothetical protein
MNKDPHNHRIKIGIKKKYSYVDSHQSLFYHHSCRSTNDRNLSPLAERPTCFKQGQLPLTISEEVPTQTTSHYL